MDLNLNRKVALVTGGSHGIGQAICVELAKEGCDIAFCARGERYDLETTTKRVGEFGVSCLPIKGDTDTFASVDSIFTKTMDALGRIDILINNVGGGSTWGNEEDWEKTHSSKWEEVMYHNYMTTVWFTNLVLPGMLTFGFGRVVSISSIYGKESGGMPWFASAKAAQAMLMKNYSQNTKFVTKGITFNTVCPGYTDVHDPRKVFVKNEARIIPMRRYAEPNEISPIVAFLCSSRASYINGATIVVDGGFSKSI